MDERQRVIRDLLIRLSEVGINPDRPFLADFIPGQGWTFSQDEHGASPGGSSSSVREEEQNAIPERTFRPTKR